MSGRSKMDRNGDVVYFSPSGVHLLSLVSTFPMQISGSQQAIGQLVVALSVASSCSKLHAVASALLGGRAMSAYIPSAQMEDNMPLLQLPSSVEAQSTCATRPMPLLRQHSSWFCSKLVSTSARQSNLVSFCMRWVLDGLN